MMLVHAGNAHEPENAAHADVRPDEAVRVIGQGNRGEGLR